ncbi:hypothetical protein VTN00DRAFT_5579 [Thermoascus crustaceus]|uniref:uncharacterized protein n=1 Tax=Thermoascus crustaceus TaxID=5088 RepID=UPI0037425A25
MVLPRPLVLEISAEDNGPEPTLMRSPIHCPCTQTWYFVLLWPGPKHRDTTRVLCRCTRSPLRACSDRLLDRRAESARPLSPNTLLFFRLHHYITGATNAGADVDLVIVKANR